MEITGVKEGVKKIPKPIVCPTSEWMDQARMYVSKWNESTLLGSREDRSRPIEYLPPHHYIPILGDGNCLFRAISKVVTGIEDNHVALRAAVVNWMQHDSHPPALAQYVVSDQDSLAKIRADPSLCCNMGY